MTGKREWSQEEFDVWLYNSMDAEGKRAWRKIFGLPELLKNGNPPADPEQDEEIDY